MNKLDLKKHYMIPSSVAIVFVVSVFLCCLGIVPLKSVEAASEKISKSKKTIYVGDTFKLKIKNTKKTFTWKSSDTKVATVGKKNGKVKGVSAGKAVITAKSGSKSYKCTVTVKAAKNTTGKDNDNNGGNGNNGNENNNGSIDKNDNTSALSKDWSPNSIEYENIEDMSGKSSYGLLEKHQRTEYQSTYSFFAEDEKSMIKGVREAMENGAETIEVNFRSYDYGHWWGILEEHMMHYSELSGYMPFWQVTGSGTDKTLIITPTYKKAWKAVIYMRHTGYEADEEIVKLYKTGYSLAEKAVELYPNDVEAALLYINNTLCDITTYSNPIPSESDCPQRDADGVFYLGDGVCEAYTAAMRLVLNILGLENNTIINRTGTHIWNYVKLNGTWYHIDVTWNDVTNYAGEYYNEYFLLTDDKMMATNSTDTDRTRHSWYNPVW